VIKFGGVGVTRRRTLKLLAVLAAGGLVLIGCSAKQEASHTLPTTTAAETTAALPPLGPKDMPMPAKARTKDAAGAEAFVRYYIGLINRTSTVMDATPLREFSDGCRDCDRLAASVENDAAVGHHYMGGEITLKQVGPALMKEKTAEFPLLVDQADFAVLEAAGGPVDGGSQAFSDLKGGAALRWDETRHSWAMSGLTLG
jgi:hypothetical protein